METISITWSIYDVLEQCPHLTDEQAMNVLIRLEEDHDANVGINWTVIQVTADNMYPQTR